MSEDYLDRAVRALRSSGDGIRFDLRARTRVRILHAMAAHSRARQRVVLWVLPLATTFMLSTAWASSQGYLDRSWRAMRQAFSAPTVRIVVASDPRQGPAGRAPLGIPTEAAAAPSATPVQDTPLVSAADLRVVQSPPARAPSPRGAALGASGPDARAGAVVEPADTDALYAAAHRCHFVDRNPVGAVAAWDAYLSVAPDGPLAPEARYNRAVMLARLGRRAEASAALLPFADGRYGGYRQREAAQMIAALGRAR